jgi:HD domain
LAIREAFEQSRHDRELCRVYQAFRTQRPTDSSFTCDGRFETPTAVGNVGVMVSVETAEQLAESELADSLPRRWRHVRSVARRARWVAKTLSLSDDLVAAAWLHDIGYAPELVETGFHPLDGARYLRRIGLGGQVVSLVAHHSCAQIEATVRSLGPQLAEFSPADPLLSDALLYCDMTTGPDGDYVRPADRLVEIRGRYGPDHEVTRFVELAASEILTTAGRVEELLAAQPR